MHLLNWVLNYKSYNLSNPVKLYCVSCQNYLPDTASQLSPSWFIWLNWLPAWPSSPILQFVYNCSDFTTTQNIWCIVCQARAICQALLVSFHYLDSSSSTGCWSELHYQSYNLYNLSYPCAIVQICHLTTTQNIWYVIQVLQELSARFRWLVFTTLTQLLICDLLVITGQVVL
jgi:hypothetical protein